MENMELQPEGARRCLQGPRKRLSNSGICRIDEHGNVRRAGHHLMQHLEPLRPYLYIQAGHARQVAAGPIQAGDKSNIDRINRYTEDDGYRCSRGLCRLC